MNLICDFLQCTCLVEINRKLLPTFQNPKKIDTFIMICIVLKFLLHKSSNHSAKNKLVCAYGVNYKETKDYPSVNTDYCNG